MSWKDYQSDLSVKTRKKRRWTQCIVFVLGAFVLGVTYHWGKSLAKPLANVVKSTPLEEAFPKDATFEVPFEAVDMGVDQVKSLMFGRDVTLHLSLDSSLQHFIQKKLEKYALDWAGVVVMEPDSGRVLSLSSFSAAQPEFKNLYLYAGFPAASIFKVVTAGALLEQTTNSHKSTFNYAGDMSRIHKRSLESKSRGTTMTLSKAFAQSANGIFGKIGTEFLGDEMLEEYANRFGFNESIPFELPVGVSRVNQEERNFSPEVKTGRLAAGFGKVGLSPLHGAMIASSIIMDGNMMRPTLVDQVTFDDKVLYQTKPQVWKTPFSSNSAKDMKAMMRETITTGTARKSFRLRKSNIVHQLEIGGKTGSLSGTEPKGRNEWFVSYAVDPRTQKKLAIGVVIVNDKYWKIKPAQLTQWIYQEYFERFTSMALASPKGDGYGS